ncbi:DUF1642 domain-containing protein [Enterococcus mundtii]|uniref:DUF1642 domain-containing protein n=1 Tax=Enterococcus mundtii TaxID=53346 RepID=UPI002DBFEBA7|nr:DUF1642 domain-containing protein [Enterococcus mundtii]MEC3942725.1 DUF1642 domain-containing protein [Enterococcus mundtii]
MNKQELIGKYNAERAKLRPYCPDRNSITEQLKASLYKEFVSDLERLDESQKKIILKCAHEFILEGTGLGLSYFEIITSAESFANAKPQDEFAKWLRKNSGLFIKALINGYEVEQEPLYYVYFPEITASVGIEEAYLMKTRNGVELADNNDFDDMKFTEQEIKTIDERYWAFAVPVEEAVEE